MLPLKFGARSNADFDNVQLNRFTFLLSVASLTLFFVPLLQICVDNESNNFCLSYFNILASKQFLLNLKSTINASFNFSILTKTCLMSALIFTCLAIILTYFKKFNVSAICFLLAGCCSSALLPALNELKNEFIKLQISSNKIFINIMWPFFLVVLTCFACCATSLASINTEHLAKTVFLCLACSSFFCLGFIIIYMIVASGDAVKKFGFLKLLTSAEWNPDFFQFGVLNMAKASIFSAFGAILISAPIGILAAVFLSEICSKQVLKVFAPLVDLMAGVPSVVFGFFGMTIIVPAIKKVFYGFKTHSGNPVVGDSLLAVILVLMIMVLPTIIKTSLTALQSVPRQYKEASFGLGANKTETIFKVCLPAAKTTIASGLILALGRAIGETMAVIMVAGNIANPPELLGTVRLLTTGIALNLSYASGLLKSVLFFMGLILLIIITAINVLFNLICKKAKN